MIAISSIFRKKTNVAETSIKCYHEIQKEGLLERETDLIVKILAQHQPTTSRNLSYLSNKERGNITRTLFDLVESGRVKIAFTGRCPITSRTVRYYSLNEDGGLDG